MNTVLHRQMFYWGQVCCLTFEPQVGMWNWILKVPRHVPETHKKWTLSHDYVLKQDILHTVRL